MAQPTTGVYFSQSTPAAPPGDQIAQPQTDGASPEQSVTFVPQRATTALRGTVKPDGTTITIDSDGTIHSVASTGSGGGTTTSGGAYVCVTPAGAKDGSNTQYTIPSTVLAGTAYIYVRNGVVQPQLGGNARYAVQGTQLTTSTPLAADDWHEFYYVSGSPSSETGGGGSVTGVPVAYMQSSKATRGTFGALSAAYGANVTAGNLLVAVAGCYGGFITSFGSATMTDTLGNTWTKIVEKHYTNSNIIIWATLATSGGANTATSTLNAGAANDLVVLEYSGPAAVAIDTTGTAQGGTPIAVPTITTAAAVELLLVGTYDETHASIPTASANYALREYTANTDGESLAVFDRVVTTIGTYGGETVSVSPTSPICTLALAAFES